MSQGDILLRGGVVIWVIAALSVIALAIILWKVWHLWRLGAWRRREAEPFVAGQAPGKGGGLRAQVASAALSAARDPGLNAEQAQQETERVARRALLDARSGLRALDAIATAAPLLGLLGTVLGMIAAFQALQVSGARADPSVLAGGIWEALLTTAAGMAVAIPASLALAWFDGVVERVAADMEDAATRILLATART